MDVSNWPCNYIAHTFAQVVEQPIETCHSNWERKDVRVVIIVLNVAVVKCQPVSCSLRGSHILQLSDSVTSSKYAVT